MVGILRGESTNFHGLLDLVEKQGDYRGSIEGFKAQEGQSH
jgi:hypothetical protein